MPFFRVFYCECRHSRKESLDHFKSHMPYTHRELSLDDARKTYLPSAEERSYWPKFTREHVATHATLKDGWCVIHERVYDITLFAITHPGFHNAGQVSTALAITRSLGADATEEFEYVHSRLAWKQLHDFQVGVIHRPDEDGPEMDEVDRPRVNPPGHPIPARGADKHPLPEWLGKERDFWQRYTGGVTEEVLRYLDEQGYPQERGGVEEVSGGRWVSSFSGAKESETVAEVVVATDDAPAGPDGKGQMEEARAAHHERWRREKDARGKRRMALVGGAATVGLSLLASVMARRPRRHAAKSETE